MKKFRKNGLYVFGVLKKDVSKDDYPEWVYRPIYRTGEEFLSQGIKTPLEYCQRNPDRLKSIPLSFYEEVVTDTGVEYQYMGTFTPKVRDGEKKEVTDVTTVYMHNWEEVKYLKRLLKEKDEEIKELRDELVSKERRLVELEKELERIEIERKIEEKYRNREDYGLRDLVQLLGTFLMQQKLGGMVPNMQNGQKQVVKGNG